MKFIKKSAEFVGYVVHGDDKFKEWRCPTCGMSVAEDYVCCPYCGQYIKFPALWEDEPDTLMEMKMKANSVNTGNTDGVSRYTKTDLDYIKIRDKNFSGGRRNGVCKKRKST